MDDARTGPPPVGGEVASWTFRSHGGVQVWDWSLAPPDPRQLGPIRSPRSTEKSRHIPVQAYSVTVGGEIRVESGLEHDLVLDLDRRPEITWLVAQPARLVLRSEGRARVHTPDLLSVGPDDAVTIWDVRPAVRQDERFQQASAMTGAACAAVGWSYEVFAGLPEVRRYNLRWVTSYRREMPWYAAAREVLVTSLASGPWTVGDVLAADRGAGHLVSTLWHLVWTGEVIVDLDTQLSRGSVVTLRPPGGYQ